MEEQKQPAGSPAPRPRLRIQPIPGLDNTGFVVLNPPAVSEARKTIIILGVARSGTSMVAGVLERLGVPMGHKKDNVVFEDREIARALETTEDPAAFEALVADRNAKYDIWGWKRPNAILYVQRFEERVRNPHYIITFRDFLSIASRNVISMAADFADSLFYAQNAYGRVLEFMSTTQAPCLLVSYEKALVNREALVDSLIAFAGLAPTGEQRRRAAEMVESSPQAYRVHARRYRGVLDRFQDGVLLGWARCSDNQDPIMVDVLVDDRLVSSVPADQVRPDLRKLGWGEGRYGFRIDISDHLADGREHSVRVRTQADQRDLHKSPIKVTWTKPR